MRDLLGFEPGAVTAEFPAEEEVDGFVTNAAALGVSTLLAEAYAAAAEALAARAIADLPRLLACDTARQGEEACARVFVARFGGRAFRRPLATEESDRFMALYASARRELGFAQAIEALAQAFLQSSAFLYRVEGGGPRLAGAPNVYRLTGHETATRLAYLLWGTMPDDELMAAAAAGRLDGADGVATEARRLLAHPRARTMTRQFAEQWLGLDDLRSLRKDTRVYPAFVAGVGPLLAEETARVFDAVVWDGTGRLGELFVNARSARDATLARFYGEPGGGAELEMVALDPARRSGLLTHGSFLAGQAKSNDGSPILRGRFVRTRILCEHLPDPPGDAVIVPPAPDPKLTTRERFARHAQHPACAGCHALIDPVGLGFESYDGIGRHRATENGRPVDAKGFLRGTDVEGSFDGAIELSRKLAASAQVRGCFLRSYLRFGYGRGETADDACTLRGLEGVLAEAQGDVRVLLLAATQTAAFLYRTQP